MTARNIVAVLPGILSLPGDGDGGASRSVIGHFPCQTRIPRGISQRGGTTGMDIKRSTCSPTNALINTSARPADRNAMNMPGSAAAAISPGGMWSNTTSLITIVASLSARNHQTRNGIIWMRLLSIEIGKNLSM